MAPREPGRAPVTTARLPPWLKRPKGGGAGHAQVARLVRDLGLHTVCQSAKCPNRGCCWDERAATFLLLGDRCTRGCAFCAVDHRRPLPPDPDEPSRLACAVAELGLRYVVLTSVDRDDLPDAGAAHWAAAVCAVRAIPGVQVEVLTPDFLGRPELIAEVVAAGPLVFGHNLETSARLTREIRSANRYERSLDVLRVAKAAGQGLTKSGFMVGLGETDAEVEELLRDLRAADVDIVTIGQYLRPGRAQLPVARYVEPAQFDAWAARARELGFKAVASGPFVRSSYQAEALAATARG